MASSTLRFLVQSLVGILATIILLALCVSALSESALSICAEATSDDVSADVWNLVVNGTYRPLMKKRPSNTHSWQAMSIMGMDNVNLAVVKMYDDQTDYQYTLMPITHNRNAANIEGKVIVVRLGSTPDQGKRVRDYNYFVVGDLVGCNVKLPHDLGVHWQGLRWDYAIVAN